ncbi:poly(U)-specific endoribonuclease-B [Phoenix dactylifera]|uniref:Poly(U)-specific endoribonuclease-B n=1 Tax=Phoenix dactylifera TaxID=42345 RepID=A0A8B7C9X2_PHODC|nr:poly(U)-specific endoribonuclease-B [Phoenix dactylifera]
MEGLIKGLIDVALGGGRDDGEDAPRTQSPPRDEQSSRSTWAEVVSSGHHEEAEEEQHSSYRYDQSPWSSRKDEISHPHDRSSWSSTKEGEEKSDGDWEVVGKKKQHHRPPRGHQMAPTDTWHRYKVPASEQEYIDDADYGLDVKPTREELDDLSKACSRLWELDLNRLVPGKDYEIDCGEGKKVYQEGDRASGSLFSWVSNDTWRRPTYSRFCSLLDNYNPHEGCKEVITSQEMHEQVAFIEEISRTAPIKYLYKYLVYKDVISDDYEEFKRMMIGLWFDLYGRGGGSSCSSAFEHVFVGEIKGRGEQEVSGFHNWIQFYLEEAKGRVDYQGYIFPRRRGHSPDSETQLLTIQFEWNGVLKSLSSSLLGVSPEFEIALYTFCFFVGGEDNHVYLGPYSVNIKCYRLGNKIGSAFPIAEC